MYRNSRTVIRSELDVHGHFMRENHKPRVINQSTQRFIEEARQTEGYSLFDFLHGYVYARWPYLYIGIGTGEHPISKTLEPILNGFARLFDYLPSNNEDFDINTGD